MQKDINLTEYGSNSKRGFTNYIFNNCWYDLRDVLDYVDKLQKAFALACRYISDNCPHLFEDITDAHYAVRNPDSMKERPWFYLQRYFTDIAMTEPVCRVCGCTQYNPCPDSCSWADMDLCSDCVGIKNESGKKHRRAKMAERYLW